ncbi:MAG: peptidoglycan DD-metalloendopeptidase family protein [Rhodospirillales bacterium]|nr:peptidoglycan DD-metalloendopeptidase family protein [Rhodospirillales bacterium]
MSIPADVVRVVVIAVVLAVGAADAQAQKIKSRDRAAEDFPQIDVNGDDKLSVQEWKRRGNFEKLDSDGDGVLSFDEFSMLYAGHDDKQYTWQPVGPRGVDGAHDASAIAARVDVDALDKETLCAIGRSRKCDAEASIKRGLIETGLGPDFAKDAICPGIDDYWAMDYASKRTRETYHGGIDMPVPWGTPILAAAAGTVVGKFQGEDSPRGKEIVLRHSPEDTGIPLWIYTQYGHLDALPDLAIGQRVRMGEYLGPTGNSGVSGKGGKQISLRRPAVHFAVFYSTDERYAENNDVIIPVDGRWMDPVALYRKALPLDSVSMKALAEMEKLVPIPIMFDDGSLQPADTKLIWPYACKSQ